MEEKRSDVSSWKVSELSAFLKKRNIRTDHLVEKMEYVALVEKAFADGVAPVTQSPKFTYPHFQPSSGYVTDTFRLNYINRSINAKTLPKDAARYAHIAGLIASNNPEHPIYFWQLFSVLGEKRIEDIVTAFYSAVFNDKEDWFVGTFKQLNSLNQHIWAQKMFWCDVMGGGSYYHGGKGRLAFHHSRAHKILTRKGAERWLQHMMATLEKVDLTSDRRVRPAICDFLHFFMEDYARDFSFDAKGLVEVPNRTSAAASGRAGKTTTNSSSRPSLLDIPEEEIRNLSVKELRMGLAALAIDWSDCLEKDDLIKKAIAARPTSS